MKKILTLILFSVFALSISCKKSEAPAPELKTEVSLTGTWELRKINGIQVAGAPSVFAAGNGRILQFSGKDFMQMNAGAVVKSGTYMLSKEAHGPKQMTV